MAAFGYKMGRELEKSFRQRCISARLFRRKCPEPAALSAAFRAAHALCHIFEPGIPTTEPPEHERLRFALMTAFATCQHQRVLAKLIAQSLDVKSARHAA